MCDSIFLIIMCMLGTARLSCFEILLCQVEVLLRARVRACVRVRACMRACVRACVRGCPCGSDCEDLYIQISWICTKLILGRCGCCFITSKLLQHRATWCKECYGLRPWHERCNSAASGYAVHPPQCITSASNPCAQALAKTTCLSLLSRHYL